VCMKRQTLILSLSLCLVLAAPAHAERFKYCHDGDICKTYAGKSVRFACMDSQELKQPMGYAARDHLKSILSEEVELRCVGKSHKRAVCFVTSGGRDINAEMVGDGYAFSYTKYRYCQGDYGALLMDDEQYAKQNRLGVWSQSDGGQRPWDFRHQ
jgi:endonuclease YncB( thermonuclease family)